MTSIFKPYYVVVFTDCTSLYTSIFHLEFIYSCWFEVASSAEIIGKIIISQGIQSDLLALHHIERLRISNVYIETVRETVNR
ncbi:unnamed protein product [Rhizophagus irregularis]|uniref:Uncharacterized protein n=1 Tax=Rhizophagus irregularis TaxID=588596 RepID=A0A2I1GUT2_9GLOM|nr:hypothetical protein RhiirA4_466889 [Rhizophagus irregularis]CAB4416974.1 unnamed protein product [Rhizophagus irregularis]